MREHHKSSSDGSVKATLDAYEKIHAEYYARNRLLNDDVKHSLDEFIRYMEGREVLDVGCAGGRETGYLASKGLVATGCDLSPSFVKTASRAHPECKFFVADMRRLEGHEAYDGIWCNSAFLHVPKRDALVTLEGFHRLLRPRGVLYLSVMRGEFEGLRENKQMDWPERHFSEYTQEELDAIAGKAGFEKLAGVSKQTDWGPVFLHGFYRK